MTVYNLVGATALENNEACKGVNKCNYAKTFVELAPRDSAVAVFDTDCNRVLSNLSFSRKLENCDELLKSIKTMVFDYQKSNRSEPLSDIINQQTVVPKEVNSYVINLTRILNSESILCILEDSNLQKNSSEINKEKEENQAQYQAGPGACFGYLQQYHCQHYRSERQFNCQLVCRPERI